MMDSPIRAEPEDWRLQMFPFSMSELQQSFPGLVATSFIVPKRTAFWIDQTGTDKRLALLTRTNDRTLASFQGEQHEYQASYVVKFAPLNHANARALRDTLPWLRPALLGLTMSAGTGDRIGLATPGHVRAFRHVWGDVPGSTLLPIFAQQSIREMQRTNRTPDHVMTDATFGAFEAGWRGRLGADADHLKTPADIDACADAGLSFYTIDPGDYVNSAADEASPSVIQADVAALPWKDLESTQRDLERNYVGRKVNLESCAITFDEPVVPKAAAKYGHAIAHIVMMFRYLASKGIPFELEVSVDETNTPTTHAEHIFVVRELKRLGVRWVSLAPRYIGRFEKSADYIGDLAAFEQDFAIHAEIARVLGPYKLSIHTGSDKFSIYPIIAQRTRGLVHLKTAGTSYLEALRTISAIEPGFFRDVYAFARDRYETDRASYLLSARLDRAPLAESMPDADLPTLLNQFDAREILHVTFGSVLTARAADGRLRFYDHLMALLRANLEAYASNLEAHFVRHLKPFATRGKIVLNWEEMRRIT